MAILEPSIEKIRRQKVQPTEGEWRLLKFLFEKLDDTFEVYYNPFLNGDKPDFAIMKKGSGVLLIEVKDWELDKYDINSSTDWVLKKDRTPIKSPLAQVLRYKKNLFELHSDELYTRYQQNNKNWEVIGCAVYFHNATRDDLTSFLLDKFSSNRHLDYKKYLGKFELLGSDSLNENSLNHILTRFWFNKKSIYFDDVLYRSIKRYLKPPIHKLEEGKDINYTKEQHELIRSEIRPRRKIKGAAGCGKTLVLAQRAVNAHIRTGKEVLILTYNLSLKNYIHDRISDVREEFDWSYFYITNYHQFFKTQANNYNLEISNLKDFENVDFFKIVDQRITKYDVVLIDEVQDYMQSWIDIITKYFTHDETEFVVFGDEKQNIYDRPLDENKEPIVRTVPGVWNKTLNTSHRFSSNIGNIALKFQKMVFNQKYNLDDFKVLFQLDFNSRIVEYHSFKDYSAQDLYDVVYEILERNKIHSSDAGVLCSKVELLRELDFMIRTKKKERTTTTFESKEEYDKLIGDKNAVDILRRNKKNHFWMETGTLKLSTTHSFKGWEINTLFLIIEEEESDSEFTNAELIYTALTRAQCNLFIFNLGNARYDDFFKSEIQNYFVH
jgi:hypothetical protein